MVTQTTVYAENTLKIKADNKQDKLVFLTGMREATRKEQESVHKYIKSISKPTGVNFFNE